MPCLLQDLQINDATEADCIYLSKKLGKDISMKKIIVLVSEGKNTML